MCPGNFGRPAGQMMAQILPRVEHARKLHRNAVSDRSARSRSRAFSRKETPAAPHTGGLRSRRRQFTRVAPGKIISELPTQQASAGFGSLHLRRPPESGAAIRSRYRCHPPCPIRRPGHPLRHRCPRVGCRRSCSSCGAPWAGPSVPSPSRRRAIPHVHLLSQGEGVWFACVRRYSCATAELITRPAIQEYVSMLPHHRPIISSQPTRRFLAVLGLAVVCSLALGASPARADHDHDHDHEHWDHGHHGHRHWEHDHWVYGPPYGVVVSPPPVYVAPAPVYVAPAPVYAPPVYAPPGVSLGVTIR